MKQNYIFTVSTFYEGVPDVYFYDEVDALKHAQIEALSALKFINSHSNMYEYRRDKTDKHTMMFSDKYKNESTFYTKLKANGNYKMLAKVKKVKIK